MSAARHHRHQHWLAVAVVVVAVVGLVAAIAPRSSSAGAAAEPAPEVTARTARVSLAGGGWVTLERPEGDGPHPVLLHVPGGGWASLDPTPVRAAFGQDRALDQGWAVATVGYPTGGGVTADDQVAAVGAALRWATGPGAAELGLGGPVVASGHSAGAHLLSLATSRAQPAERPEALVLVAGVYDLADDVRSSPLLGRGLATAFGCRDGSCPAAEHLEPLRAVAGDLPPAVLVHGRADQVTPPAGSERYAAALAAAGVATELQLVDAGRHRRQGTDAAVRLALAQVLAQARDARSSR